MSDAKSQPDPRLPREASPSTYPYWAPRFWHGMRFGTWLNLLIRNRFAVSPHKAVLAASITAASLLNSFASAFDRLMFGYKIRSRQLKEPPLFVLGHWRSGTTMLHELLILDPRHTYPTTYECFAPNHFLWTEWFLAPLTRWLLPKKRPMDNMTAGWEKPQEDEFALVNLGLPSPYLVWAFPNHGPVADEYLDLVSLPAPDREKWKQTWLRFVQSVAMVGNRDAAKLMTRVNSPKSGNRVVLKSPTHTARIRTILEVFPDARFVHITREPITLFASTLRLWKSLSLVQGLQTPLVGTAWLEGQVLDTFVRMYERFEQDRELVPPGRLIDVRYEDLVADPVGQMRQIYDELDLGDFTRVEAAIAGYFQQKRDYRTNEHTVAPETAELVRRRWAPYFERYGYAGPDVVSASA